MSGKRCPYCHMTINEPDLALHYVHCIQVRMAFDDSYEHDFGNVAYAKWSAEAKRNHKQAVRSAPHGRPITVSQTAASAYARVERARKLAKLDKQLDRSTA